MKNFKQNLLKTVIGVACAVLPAHKLHAQAIINVDNVTNEIFWGIGGSYTMPSNNDVRGMGVYVNGGVATWVDMYDSKINGCAIILINGGGTRFNTDKYRYDCDVGVRFGVGYGPATVMLIRESGLSVGNRKDIVIKNAYGCGISVALGLYTRINADFMYTMPASNNQSTDVPDELAAKRNIVRLGLVYTLSRKLKQK